MKVQTSVVCPYCGHINKISVDVDTIFSHKELLYCDNEEGGCDMLFVFSLQLRPYVHVAKIGEFTMDDSKED